MRSRFLITTVAALTTFAPARADDRTDTSTKSRRTSESRSRTSRNANVLVDPVHTVGEMPGPAVPELAYRLANARVVAADYDAIRAHFKYTENWTTNQIDRWLIWNSLVSEHQVHKGNGVFNSAIPVDEEHPVGAVRPRDFNRAIDYLATIPPDLQSEVHVPFDQMQTRQYLDGKGAGIPNPRLGQEDGDPRTGLEDLGKALRDFIYYKVKKQIATETGEFQVIPTYAVIDPGFDAYAFNGPKKVGENRAALVLRPSHERFSDPDAVDPADRGKYFLLPEHESLQVERWLNLYGITSSGAGRAPGAKEGGVNVQGFVDGDGSIQVVDQGTYRVAPHEGFQDSERYHFYGDEPLPELGRNGIQPDPHLRVSADVFGPQNAGDFNPTHDRPTVSSYQKVDEYMQHIRKAETALSRGDRATADAEYTEARNVLERHIDGHLADFMRPNAVKARSDWIQSNYADKQHPYFSRKSCRVLLEQ